MGVMPFSINISADTYITIMNIAIILYVAMFCRIAYEIVSLLSKRKTIKAVFTSKGTSILFAVTLCFMFLHVVYKTPFNLDLSDVEVVAMDIEYYVNDGYSVRIDIDDEDMRNQVLDLSESIELQRSNRTDSTFSSKKNLIYLYFHVQGRNSMHSIQFILKPDNTWMTDAFTNVECRIENDHEVYMQLYERSNKHLKGI